MGILPPNKKQKTTDTPKNFFIYGATMNGKSYLAGEFPNPLFLDTDGNASANPYPSIPLRNIRGKDGKIRQSVVEQLDQIITELQTTHHGFETIVLDVIDDIASMIEFYVCDREGVETLVDIGYGKGYAAFNSIFQQLVIELKALPINVVYVSRIQTISEDNVTYEIPSLKEKLVNVVNGNCDYMIQCKKIGKNYIRVVKSKRKNYDREAIEDKRTVKILDSITGAFERSRQIDKKTQDAIVKELEKKEEIVIEEGNDKKNEPIKPAKPVASRTKPVIK
ncbi:alpha/beta hydrolase [Atopobacter sp. AH10]|uniref:AAA family ATPase n=1 Tax=Atopobacter sp. AH10 TaxID=2315861 RepID=UPI000EF18941|nr:AAA family ATPase [Atopobacter sp. AH10]RLK63170.1 alpha/beta hydrolase [Atopobacter sp. AH10]